MVGSPGTVAEDSEKEKQLLQYYSTPRADTFQLTQSTVSEKKLTKNNYRDRMHELLYVEEMARYEQVSEKKKKLFFVKKIYVCVCACKHVRKNFFRLSFCVGCQV
mgnify:CR=1 FL=1